MTRLVVDSTCDMPQSLIEKYNIAVLPLQVVIGEKSYRDGVDIKIEQLYEMMRQGVMPGTSQINVAETELLFRGICEAGNDFIYLSFSSNMSGTYQVAQMVVKLLREDYPERKMTVVDSQGGCMATGLMAMQTARWIASGKAYSEILLLLENMLPQVRHLLTLDSLTWLTKGGRLPRPVGYVGDKLQIKPILDVENGVMHMTRFVRGRKHTISAIVQILLEKTKTFPHQLIGITHADDLDTAKQIEQMILAKNPAAKTVVLSIGCVLGTHLGIGGVGMFFFQNPVADYDLLDEPGI